MSETAALQVWCVWEDWATDDVMAIEATAMTPGLRAQLSHERIAVIEQEAPDRHTAVRQAFPHRFAPKPEESAHPSEPVTIPTVRLRRWH